MNISLEIWKILPYNKVENWPYLVKSIANRIYWSVKKCLQWTVFFWYNKIEFTSMNPSLFCGKHFIDFLGKYLKEESNFVAYFAKKQHFVDISKTAISLAAIWAFFWWVRCPLTPKLLRAPKQSWCYFEALECSFHLSQENFTTSISWLSINKIERFRTYGAPCTFHENILNQLVIYMYNQQYKIIAFKAGLRFPWNFLES